MTGGAPVSGAGTSGETTVNTAGHTHQHEPVTGPLATATVLFGAWRSDLSVDRYPNVNVPANNAHLVTPYQAKIKAGGAVAFVISGLHQVVVYGPNVLPEHVNAQVTRPTTGSPAGTPLINDPTNRVYSGLDPSTQPRERTEVVQFFAEGKYLVICGVQPHFVNERMFGWVRVLPADSDD